ATASDNTASNLLTLAVQSFDASAAVQSLQMSGANVAANQGSDGAGVIVNTGEAVARSTLAASGNTYSAAANGNSATNQLSLTGGSATGAIGPVPTDSQGASYGGITNSSATGDLAVQNLQVQAGALSANSNATTAIENGTVVATNVDSITGSTETLDNNQNQATVQGNQATNGIALAVTNSTGETAALLSDQETNANVTATATATSAVLADLLVANSTVEAKSNVNLAEVGLNTAANSLKAGGSGATLGSGYGAAGAVVNIDNALADFAVANVQRAPFGPSIDSTADLTIGNSDAAGSVFGSAGAVDNSTLVFDGNSNGAQSTINRATNSLTLNPGADLNATAGLENDQRLTGASARATATTAITMTEPSFASSTVSIQNDSSSAQALGNVATNSLAASGVVATLTSLDLLEQGAAAQFYAQAVADYALGNVQNSNAGLVADNSALFLVATTVPTNDVTVLTQGSTIKVSGDTAQAAAQSNSATNILTLAVTDATNNSAGGHAATTALYSLQIASAPVTATSSETVAAIGMVWTSNVDMSNDTNLALAVGNDVTNTIDASATANYEAASGSWVTDTAQANGITTGDAALSNDQVGTGNITAVAQTTIGQSDNVGLTGTTSTNNSTVTLNGNTTFAEADQNRANNSLTLGAGATNGGTAALSNNQSSSGSVTAQVTATIGYSEPNANASSFSVNGNSSVAQATGNAAINALNASAGAQFVVPAGASAQTSNNGDTSGQFAVLNNQSNSASISASNTTNMTVALNGPAFAGQVGNSSLTASNNSVMALATANSANNSITITGGAGGGTSPAALSSFQTNSGSVTASIVGSSISVTAGNPSGITGSNLSVTGNSIIARATGNSVTNTITVK
ncbi:MAG TPA: hypothetical protein VHO06_04520, partial [Polyangia bacterium]|nr:hypothetical protein [Polyangia bacterium]